jgi:hypothetical protein
MSAMKRSSIAITVCMVAVVVCAILATQTSAMSVTRRLSIGNRHGASVSPANANSGGNLDQEKTNGVSSAKVEAIMNKAVDQILSGQYVNLGQVSGGKPTANELVMSNRNHIRKAPANVAE